jgi:hypothetical protein
LLISEKIDWHALESARVLSQLVRLAVCLARGVDFVSTHFLARLVGRSSLLKMPEIGDVMDVTIDDLSPEQQA